MGEVTARRNSPITRLTLTLPEAASALGVGESTFREYVLPGLRTVRPSPRVVLIAVRELERWIDANQAEYVSQQRGTRAARQPEITDDSIEENA